jgi:menaquinone-dependent protoporphyrinogen oxidase
MTMSARILVVYGTTDGQTRKIASAIGNALRSDGCEVDVVDAAAKSPDVDAYAGVIVAASVHAGGYQRPVLRWVAGHVDALDRRPNAFVSVCLGVLEHNPKTDAALAGIRNAFFSMTGWQPSECKVVGGALKYRRYNWLKRWAMRRIVAKGGGDTDTSRDYEYTDWDDVKAFAHAFGRRFAPPDARLAV